MNNILNILTPLSRPKSALSCFLTRSKALGIMSNTPGTMFLLPEPGI